MLSATARASLRVRRAGNGNRRCWEQARFGMMGENFEIICHDDYDTWMISFISSLPQYFRHSVGRRFIEHLLDWNGNGYKDVHSRRNMRANKFCFPPLTSLTISSEQNLVTTVTPISSSCSSCVREVTTGIGMTPLKFGINSSSNEKISLKRGDGMG